MRPYQILASLYDQDWGEFTLDYIPFLRQIDMLFKLPDKSVLDAACGTGNITLLLSTMGCQVTGFDRSLEMLHWARKKCDAAKTAFFQADMRTFAVKSVFDFVINTYDSINYLLNLNEIEQFFQQVYFALKTNGIFIFDINTDIAFGYRHIGSFRREIAGIQFIQKHEFFEDNCIEKTTFYFSDGEEVHWQRGYKKDVIDELLAKSRFLTMNCLKAFRLTPGDENSERLIYVVRKV